MNYNITNMKTPTHLQHKPIIAVDDYDQIDGIYAGNSDTKALSIGQAQYDEHELSAKTWRRPGQKWSRQSEEMPLHRVLDLSILLVASLLPKNTSTSLKQKTVDGQNAQRIMDYFKNNKSILEPKLKELRNLLNQLP